MRREDQRRGPHQRQHPADRVVHHLRPVGRAAVEDVPPVAVEQAEMHVEAVARPVEERLGHEARRQLVLAGDPLDEALEIQRVVRRLQRVGTCSRLISNCPPPFSEIALSTGTPCASQAA